jgi:hypothetical protein
MLFRVIISYLGCKFLDPMQYHVFYIDSISLITSATTSPLTYNYGDFTAFSDTPRAFLSVLNWELSPNSSQALRFSVSTLSVTSSNVRIYVNLFSSSTISSLIVGVLMFSTSSITQISVAVLSTSTVSCTSYLN